MSTETTAPERLLTIAMAAELTNYDETTIHQWLDRGLPFVAAGTGRRRPRKKDIRIRSSALWEWVKDLEIIRKPGQSKQAATPSPRASAPRTKSLSAWRDVKRQQDSNKR